MANLKACISSASTCASPVVCCASSRNRHRSWPSAFPRGRRARTEVGMAEARTRIHIGAHETLIETWSPEGGACEWMLYIGTEALGDGPFRHTPPTALEIENAIEHVENAVMPLL